MCWNDYIVYIIQTSTLLNGIKRNIKEVEDSILLNKRKDNNVHLVSLSLCVCVVSLSVCLCLHKHTDTHKQFLFLFHYHIRYYVKICTFRAALSAEDILRIAVTELIGAALSGSVSPALLSLGVWTADMEDVLLVRFLGGCVPSILLVRRRMIFFTAADVSDWALGVLGLDTGTDSGNVGAVIVGWTGGGEGGGL